MPDPCPYCKNGVVVVKTKGMPKTKEPCAVCQNPLARATWARANHQRQNAAKKEKR